MSHITKYIDKPISNLSEEEVKDLLIESYPSITDEQKAMIKHTLNLSRNFENGAYIEDENSYVFACIPATTNTLIIKQKYENYKK